MKLHRCSLCHSYNTRYQRRLDSFAIYCKCLDCKRLFAVPSISSNAFGKSERDKMSNLSINESMQHTHFRHNDCEAYEGLLIATMMASYRKVHAGLEYAGSGQYQDYPPGIIELGVALDALDMMLNDLLSFVERNAQS